MAAETGAAARGAAQIEIGPAPVLCRRRRGHAPGRPAHRSGRSGDQGRLARDELLLRAHDRARGLLAARRPAPGTGRATARRQMSGTGKRRAWLLFALLQAATGAQQQTLRETPLRSAVERQLSTKKSVLSRHRGL